MPEDEKSYSIDDLLYLMSRLRDPDTGCPWDIKQTYKTITPSTLEEACEVIDTIEREDYAHLCEELGDLLFQVVFYSQLGREEQRFSFDDVIQSITSKLLRRHPHVFPEGTLASRRSANTVIDEADINASWERIKQSERNNKGSEGVLDDLPTALPSLIRSAKLQKRAAKVGFDWPNVEQVIEKLEEEVAELKQAIYENDTQAMEEELGDVLFSCVNVGRHLKLESEKALRQANRKFESRFRYIELALSRSGKSFESSSLDVLESLWQEAKSEGL